MTNTQFTKQLINETQRLINIIEQQQTKINNIEEKIKKLEDEINNMKKSNPCPYIYTTYPPWQKHITTCDTNISKNIKQ